MSEESIQLRDVVRCPLRNLQSAPTLHWLMVSPEGLHVTTPDADLRCRSWQHIRHLVDLCADLGPDGIQVFGSPKQRWTTDGLSRAEATRRFVGGLAAVAPHAGLCIKERVFAGGAAGYNG